MASLNVNNGAVGAGAGLMPSRTTRHEQTIEFPGGGVYVGASYRVLYGFAISKIPHGQGKRTFKNGAIYEGKFKNGESHGHGKYIFPNGDTYEGAFVKGKRQGQGTYVTEDGRTKYEGDWVNGQQEGHGKYTYPNGDVYEGELRNGMPHGRGELLIFNIGTRYHGEFKAGNLDGQGHTLFLGVGDRAQTLYPGHYFVVDKIVKLSTEVSSSPEPAASVSTQSQGGLSPVLEKVDETTTLSASSGSRLRRLASRLFRHERSDIYKGELPLLG